MSHLTQEQIENLSERELIVALAQHIYTVCPVSTISIDNETGEIKVESSFFGLSITEKFDPLNNWNHIMPLAMAFGVTLENRLSPKDLPMAPLAKAPGVFILNENPMRALAESILLIPQPVISFK